MSSIYLQFVLWGPGNKQLLNQFCLRFWGSQWPKPRKTLIFEVFEGEPELRGHAQEVVKDLSGGAGGNQTGGGLNT